MISPPTFLIVLFKKICRTVGSIDFPPCSILLARDLMKWPWRFLYLDFQHLIFFCSYFPVSFYWCSENMVFYAIYREGIVYVYMSHAFSMMWIFLEKSSLFHYSNITSPWKMTWPSFNQQMPCVKSWLKLAWWTWTIRWNVKCLRLMTAQQNDANNKKWINKFRCQKLS